MGAIGGETATVINQIETGDVDALGVPICTTETTAVPGCSLQLQHAHRETTPETGEVLEGRFKLFLPVWAPLTDSSQIQLGSAVYIVDGEPGTWVTRTGRAHHIECFVRLIQS